MAGVMPHTDKALNPVVADQTVEAELATLHQTARVTQAGSANAQIGLTPLVSTPSLKVRSGGGGCGC